MKSIVRFSSSGVMLPLKDEAKGGDKCTENAIKSGRLRHDDFLDPPLDSESASARLASRKVQPTGWGKMKRMLFAMFVVLVACSDIWAQATAQIAGTARDQSGAVLPGVEVTVTQTETGATRTAVTNETGSYVLSNLPIGPY